MSFIGKLILLCFWLPFQILLWPLVQWCLRVELAHLADSGQDMRAALGLGCWWLVVFFPLSHLQLTMITSLFCL